MNAASILTAFLDRHYRVPPGGMIRLSLWTCKGCGGTTWRAAPAGAVCETCARPLGRAVPACPCGSASFAGASGDLYDADHFLEESDLAAVLCSACASPRALR